MHQDTAIAQINQIAEKAVDGYRYLQTLTLAQRAGLMFAIADQIEALDDRLIETAHNETALPIGRLNNEKGRTVGQWRSYAEAMATGIYCEARIDQTLTGVDLRKYNIGLGPVAVFGASNFPYAFSTAGGDTASAIAAGCSVVVKAHPAHQSTSDIMAEAIRSGLEKFGAPLSVFGYVCGASNEIGSALVKHSAIKAVAFTGSFQGGMALNRMCQDRPEPIPVFAEMGSINPVFALPEYLTNHAENLAAQYLASLTLGVGQFCTNPGIFVGIEGSPMDDFFDCLRSGIAAQPSANMLHRGIWQNYENGLIRIEKQPGVALLGVGQEGEVGQGTPHVYQVNADQFLQNDILAEEVFGPAGIVVLCKDVDQMLAIARQLRGQLTITLSATAADIEQNAALVDTVKEKAGRLLFGGMPTGVEVVHAMQHGGPFPATTDARFTSVGPDAIKRFLRPISFQNWPHDLLPDELKDSNPLNIPRIENKLSSIPSQKV